METPNGQLRIERAKLAILVVTALVGWLAFRWISADGELPQELTADNAPATDERPAFSPLAAPDARITDSERSAVQDLVQRSSSAGRASVILQIIDSETGEALDDARVHLRAMATSAESEKDEGWSLSPPLEQRAAARVAALRLIASGSSPLTSPAPRRKELWITASGYGWAQLSLYDDSPERIEIPLRREALLKVEVAGSQDYSRVHVILTSTGSSDGRAPSRSRRSTTNGTAFFKGLERGRYLIEASGVPVHGGEAERKTREIQLGSHEQRLEVIALEALWGELVLQWTEPAAEQGGSALQSVLLESLDPDVKPHLRVKLIESFETLTDPAVDERAISRARLRVPAGKTRITVRPHGTTYEVVVFPDATATLEKTLPRLYKKRVVFWDLRPSLAWCGLVAVVLSEKPSPDWVETEISTHELRDESGVIETWWPAVPFRFVLTPPEFIASPAAEESKGSSLTWPSGKAMPDDLRIEMRSPEGGLTLKQVRALLDTGQHDW